MNKKPTENIISLSSERARRVHELHEKRLQSVRAAFTKALPLAANGTGKKKNAKKKR